MFRVYYTYYKKKRINVSLASESNAQLPSYYVLPSSLKYMFVYMYFKSYWKWKLTTHTVATGKSSANNVDSAITGQSCWYVGCP
jgi:hypothetical protein